MNIQITAEAGRIDELGNGRFARSLFESAGTNRDLRVADLGEEATAEDLTTVTAGDLWATYQDPDRRAPEQLSRPVD